jgi:SOS-response transcriptional repressor LexA
MQACAIIERMVHTSDSAAEHRLEFSRRLKQAIQDAGWKRHGSATRLASLCKVTPKAAGKWLNADSMPEHDKMVVIAQELRVRAEWLEYGIGAVRNDAPMESSNVTPVHFTKEEKGYPVISWVQAGEWGEAVDLFPPGFAEEWERTDCNVGDSSFWLKVKGDSMTSPSGLSIPDGYLILVDPDTAPENGSLVVAKLDDSDEATFKKLVIDAGHHYLKPLNPSYRTIEINGNCRIVGVVREVKLKM